MGDPSVRCRRQDVAANPASPDGYQLELMVVVVLRRWHRTMDLEQHHSMEGERGKLGRLDRPDSWNVVLVSLVCSLQQDSALVLVRQRELYYCPNPFSG